VFLDAALHQLSPHCRRAGRSSRPSCLVLLSRYEKKQIRTNISVINGLIIPRCVIKHPCSHYENSLSLSLSLSLSCSRSPKRSTRIRGPSISIKDASGIRNRAIHKRVLLLLRLHVADEIKFKERVTDTRYRGTRRDNIPIISHQISRYASPHQWNANPLLDPPESKICEISVEKSPVSSLSRARSLAGRRQLA